MPRKVKEVEPVIEIQEDEVSESKAGVVMIDDTYYFKITQRQYVFGKKSNNKDGEVVYNDKLYPSTITSVFNIYFKEVLANKSMGKIMQIDDLLKLVSEIKADIKIIRERLEI